MEYEYKSRETRWGRQKTSKTYHTSQLIETAIEQLKYSLYTVLRLQGRAALLAKMERFIPDVILKMRHTHRQTVQKRTAFSRQK